MMNAKNTIKQTLLTLLFTVPQVPLLGSISGGGKVLAQATSCPAGTTAQTLNWNPANNVAGITGQNLTLNGINATISFTESAPGQVIDVNETLISDEIYGGLTGPNLRFNIGFDDTPNTPFDGPAPVGSSATLTINFSQAVTLAAPLTLLDVDRFGARDIINGTPFIYQDRVTVTAFNGATPVGVNLLSPGQYVRVTGNLAEGIVENAFPAESFGNVSAAIAAPVNRIQITYQPGTEFGNPTQDETIGLARLQVCVPTGATGTIGDTVFNDANGNNVQDTGEVGIANVPLTLTSAGTDGQLGTADDTTQTTTTNANGIYSFANLPAGTYRVAVTTPPTGFTPTLTQPNPITLAAGQTINTVDFGFQQGAGGTIGDTVFTDTNGNNVQDPGETGIPNVTLTLTGAGPDGQLGTADDTTQTTTTNNTGNYSFPNLPPGTYRVTVNNPPAGLTPSLTQSNPITLTAGQTNNTVDFGFRPGAVGTIGDAVFTDTNGNNVQDTDEAGIPNVTLTLTGAGPDGQLGTADDTTQTTTTNNTGNYSFTNLPPGTYRVTVNNPPAGSTPSLTQPNPITLTAGQTNNTVDFGFRPGAIGTIGDTVFNDTNGNNVQDPGEPGLPNITLVLAGAGPDGQIGTPDDTSQTTTTNNNGNYSFTNLPAGTYRVTVNNPPAGFNPTLTQPNLINLAAGQTNNTVDFGFTQLAQGTIGDTVYTDTNGNGVQDPGEPGISDRNISLVGAGPDGQFGTPDDTTPRTTTTDGNGRYSFTGLPPGNYRVTVTNPPAGFNPSQTPPATISLGASQNLDTADFGFTQQALGSIGDTVYTDTNSNNTQDPGEPGLNGRTVTLTGAGLDGQFGTADDIIRTTTTDSNGRYTFPNLTAGNYRVVVSNPPTGANPTQTPPATITLSAGQNLNTADFGFTQSQLGSIGDTVFIDTNRNNTQDPGERGISGATVTLTGAGPDGQFNTPDDINRSATTDENGRYLFPDLPPGTYRVTVSSRPADFSPTLIPPETVTLAAGQNLNTVDFGFVASAVGAGEPNLRLVKRITNVIRNNQSIGVNFNTFDDGPGDDDNNINQLQPVRGVRDLQTPLQSGDEVEYTIYFLAQNTSDVRFCDLIPEGTGYSNGSISVAGGGTGADQGTFFTPLAPLPPNNSCLSQTNSRGAVIVNFGTFGASSGNPSFIRFRVRVD